MPKLRLTLDSGAHSIFKEIIRKNKLSGINLLQNKKGLSYSDTDEFWEYVDRYATFVKENHRHFDFYVNVDVIDSPEKSDEVQSYLENKHKLNPMPVYHYGEPLNVLKKMMDNYEYIGIGGLGQGITKKKFMAHFKKAIPLLTDRKGLPIRKLHGFAMTSVDVMRAFPWYSVDSSSWVQYSQYGICLMPHPVYSFTKKPVEVFTSSRSKSYYTTQKHIGSMPFEQWRTQFLEYIEQEVFELGESEFVEVPVDYELDPQQNERFCHKPKKGDKTRHVERRPVLGLCNDYNLRDNLNYMFYLQAGAALPAWPWKIRRPAFLRQDVFEGEWFKYKPGSERTILYLGGCFPMMIYREKEEAVIKKVFDKGLDHCRMISFFFNEPWGRHEILMQMMKEQEENGHISGV